MAAGAVVAVCRLLDRRGRPGREKEKSYILTSGEPDRPEKRQARGARLAVRAGEDRFPRRPDRGVSDWLTAPENPLFARVAVNRLWQWHFGEGLHKTPSDFGNLGGVPTNPDVLDWLAAEFVDPQVQHEGDAPADRHLGHLQAGLGGGPGAR